MFNIPTEILGVWECVESECDLYPGSKYQTHKTGQTNNDMYVFSKEIVCIFSNYYGIWAQEKEYTIAGNMLTLPFGTFVVSIKGKTMELTATKTTKKTEANVRMVFNKIREYHD